MAPSSPSYAAISIGGKAAVIVFVFSLFGFVIESELAQYVQGSLGYRQPFFIFYLVHSAFAVIFPLHLIFLAVTTRQSTRPFLRGLSVAISNHLAPEKNSSFPIASFLWLAFMVTVGMSIPSILWFISVSLATMTDITAIGNTNAFWAYAISVKLFKLAWRPKQMLAVLCATLGTLAVVYADRIAVNA